jgi:hypothetical protein
LPLRPSPSWILVRGRENDVIPPSVYIGKCTFICFSHFYGRAGLMGVYGGNQGKMRGNSKSSKILGPPLKSYMLSSINTVWTIPFTFLDRLFRMIKQEINICWLRKMV